MKFVMGLLLALPAFGVNYINGVKGEIMPTVFERHAFTFEEGTPKNCKRESNTQKITVCEVDGATLNVNNQTHTFHKVVVVEFTSGKKTYRRLDFVGNKKEAFGDSGLTFTLYFDVEAPKAVRGDYVLGAFDLKANVAGEQE